MRPFSRWLSQSLSLATLGVLFLVIPLASRYWLGWSNPFGYLSDLAFGSFLIVLLYGRSLLLALPLMLLWSFMILGNAELIGAVGRMPETSDLKYLLDPQFVSHSTQGGGITHPYLGLALGASLLACLLCWRRRHRPLNWKWFATPAALLMGHVTLQYVQPSDADQWQQFNLPHKLMASAVNVGQLAVEDWLDGDKPEVPPDIAGLARLDLDGTPLLSGPGRARNVLVITLEGIPGAYIAANRAAINSSYQDSLMPKLSAWAERAMTTPDYVLHSHQTIRGLYAMLCGDYSKLDSGTPKGLELLNNPARAKACLPAQMHQHGFSTHFLQGAGLRFMAKDKIMPQMGFDKTLGRDWFRNKAYLEFPWGMDDKSFFEGAQTYVKQLRQQKKPWMLTLLTVGTHQPYSAPVEYLMRYPDSKKAAIAYLDDAVDAFLTGLEKQGVLKNTLVIVTSDESHGIENVRLASAWGFNLVLAPEQASLPPIKSGVYGHVDLTASILDYFGYRVPQNLSGRSLFRDYETGREIMSYTNGKLRYHDGKQTFTECDFRLVCRRYQSEGFIADEARYQGSFSGKKARLVSQRAALLDQSLQGGNLGQEYQFATRERIRLKEKAKDDWADNLIGAQYMELPKDSRTSVQMTIKVVRMDKQGAQLRLKAKEFERDVALPIPEMPLLKQGKPLKVKFAFDNPEARKAFSFHLLAEGRGVIEISDFRVSTEPLPPPTQAVDNNGQVAQKRPLHPITTLFGLLARQQDAMESELENPGEERAVLPESTELRLQQYH
ncbi:LTA synthase family protein [Pseudomonas sp. BN414]|uniref:LTA synthase family protein n=1 Tax=Pseudomonas sp. BN414 TaxID=2567888 RepID=UPI002457A067|nr:LTA synthase family protein [Pseudomonas sp. BN414]MDH4566852.1 LTA synthase family protein [Pseudomonas sp. BN414]